MLNRLCRVAGRILEWDMRVAENPRVLAELETSVGHFSLGDIHKGEMPLIACVPQNFDEVLIDLIQFVQPLRGDNAGKVYVFDYQRHTKGRTY